MSNINFTCYVTVQPVVVPAAVLMADHQDVIISLQQFPFLPVFFLLTECVFCLCCMTGVQKEEQTVKPAEREEWKRLLAQCCASPVPRRWFSCRAED